MERRDKLRRSGIRSERAKVANVAPRKAPREPAVRFPKKNPGASLGDGPGWLISLNEMPYDTISSSLKK